MNQKTQAAHPTSSTAHRRVQRSTTLNRKYVRRPNLTQGDIVRRPKRPTTATSRVPAPKRRGYVAPTSVKKTTPVVKKTVTAQKPVAAKKPIASNKPVAPKKPVATPKKPSPTKSQSEKPAKSPKSVKRIVIALVCAAACIAALVGFIKLNIPTISVHFAASQVGIDASYPSYIPSDYTLSSVGAENGQVMMLFKGSNDKSFRLSEEKSSWDSNALLNNFVKSEWDDYSTAREQGLTIYVSGSNATWVNGGILYRILADDGTLSKKQIYDLATSL